MQYSRVRISRGACQQDQQVINAIGTIFRTISLLYYAHLYPPPRPLYTMCMDGAGSVIVLTDCAEVSSAKGMILNILCIILYYYSCINNTNNNMVCSCYNADTFLSAKAQQDLCALFPETPLPWCKALAGIQCMPLHAVLIIMVDLVIL